MNTSEFMLREILDEAMERHPKLDYVAVEDFNGKIHERHEVFRGSCVGYLLKEVGEKYSSIKNLIFSEYVGSNEPVNIVEIYSVNKNIC